MDANKPLDLSQITVSPLADGVAIESFRCGNVEIDSWAKEKARKLSGINRVKIFCACSPSDASVRGFYCLSFEAKETKRLFSNYKDFPYIPVVYITYIGVLRSCQRQKLGTMLLIDALRRAYGLSEHVGFYGVALRSLNEDTNRLYTKYGFVQIDDSPNPLMLLPIQALNELFGPPT